LASARPLGVLLSSFLACGLVGEPYRGWWVGALVVCRIRAVVPPAWLFGRGYVSLCALALAGHIGFGGRWCLSGRRGRGSNGAHAPITLREGYPGCSPLLSFILSVRGGVAACLAMVA